MKYSHFFLFIAILHCVFSCRKEEPSIKPNFLFILVDDLGYHDLSCMGSRYYETPNIDRIAKSGMVFPIAYANCCVCSPSRASLLTGRYTTIHGITDYIGAPAGKKWRKNNRNTILLPPEYKSHLAFDFTTLPEMMKANGYKTFFAGKWHLGSAAEHSLPTDHGFDINKGGYKAGGPYSGGYFSPFNNPFLQDYENEKGISLSMKLATETSNFIKNYRDSSFFAYLAFYAVHAPIQTTADKWAKYRDKAESMGIQPEGFRMERVLPIRKFQDNPVYAGLVEQVDEAVGQVIQTLENLNLMENTIIIFTSDNGGVASGDNNSTSISPLRGGKGYQWEGGIRVPYFVSVPWLHNNGAKNFTPVIGMDLYPTILDLAGITPDKDVLDGVSLLPLLQGEEIADRPLFWHYPHYGNQGGEPSSIIREENWKLIHYWEDGRDELYNLLLDEGETDNLAKKETDLSARLRQKLNVWLSETHATYPVLDTERDEAAAQKWLDYQKHEKLLQLEKQRKNMLTPDWQPNADWWGSQYD